jgi:putative ABC transport system ATP-binding protein
MSTKTNLIIECKDISKTYDSDGVKTEVLKGVSFNVKEGEFLAIMGPSGSGKSTMMHILGALDVPTSGSYFLEGKDISKYTDDELANIRKTKIGFVFQAFNLLARATVMRNVELPLVYADIDPHQREQRAKEALAQAGLDSSRFNHLSNQLSGGQMQRVAIARALVNNPAIILADEPTGNLDSKTGDIVLGTFQRLNREGKTIVLITHEPYIAEHADRIIHLKDGAIVSDAAPDQKRIINPELHYDQ